MPISTHMCCNIFHLGKEGGRQEKWKEERKGGRKRGRETSMCGSLSHAPYWAPGRQPRHTPSWLGIEPVTLLFTGTQSTEPHQPGQITKTFILWHHKLPQNMKVWHRSDVTAHSSVCCQFWQFFCWSCLGSLIACCHLWVAWLRLEGPRWSLSHALQLVLALWREPQSIPSFPYLWPLILK